MRTQEEFRKELQEAHRCARSEGKIFSVTIDVMGKEHCMYCGTQVRYPKATREELVSWMSKDRMLEEEA